MTAAVLVAECIGCVPVGQRTKGATSTLCTSCELDWMLRAAGLFEAAGLVTSPDPVVRASGGDAAPTPQRCPSCGDAVRVIGPGDEECRNPQCCWFRFPAAGSYEDEQWRAW